mmetsp:Transcript_30137/g.86807  ORF Transcript_30137/g.86807 Transcript_30137/m.86807 type:complete len:242 (-) Transcript_30137:180-905(-)
MATPRHTLQLPDGCVHIHGRNVADRLTKRRKDNFADARASSEQTAEQRHRGQRRTHLATVLDREPQKRLHLNHQALIRKDAVWHRAQETQHLCGQRLHRLGRAGVLHPPELHGGLDATTKQTLDVLEQFTVAEAQKLCELLGGVPQEACDHLPPGILARSANPVHTPSQLTSEVQLQLRAQTWRGLAHRFRNVADVLELLEHLWQHSLGGPAGEHGMEEHRLGGRGIEHRCRTLTSAEHPK